MFQKYNMMKEIILKFNLSIQLDFERFIVRLSPKSPAKK